MASETTDLEQVKRMLDASDHDYVVNPGIMGTYVTVRDSIPTKELWEEQPVNVEFAFNRAGVLKTVRVCRL